MKLNIKPLRIDYSVSGALGVDDMPAVADAGFKTVFCFRPDAESEGQIASATLAEAAKAQGLNFVHIPIVSGHMQSTDVMAFQHAFAMAQKPVLGFCRGGGRASRVFQEAFMKTEQQSMAYDVVIIGGGAAGCGVAASLLRRAPNLQIAIIEPAEQHYYQPAWTLVGAGEFAVEKSQRPMAACIPQGVQWIKAMATQFVPEEKCVHTDMGIVSYQQLIVCPGLVLNWQSIEGLEEALGKNGVTSNYRYDLAPYTWQLVKNLRDGTALFTQPAMPIKCAGAPQKALYLSCFDWEKKGVLQRLQVEFHVAGAVLFGVADFIPSLMAYIQRYRVKLQFNSTLVAVNGPARTAIFQIKDSEGRVERVERTFDLLHVVPPQSAPVFIRQSPLANADGWVDVNQHTLQHVRYADIFSLGDVCSSPNAKTVAAVRKQAVVVAENLLALRANQPLVTLYDGYGGCPLTVEKGKIILAEFGFGGKLLPTWEFINPLRPYRFYWMLKKWVLPWVYWHALLKAREWYARPSKKKI